MTALVVMFLLGAACGHWFPKAWQEATNADRMEAMTRSGPLRRTPR